MRKKLMIEGMSCNHCINHLKTALSEDINGIKVIEISLEDKFAIVDIDDNVNLNKLNELIEELGFELKDIIEC
jgi:copper chaperone CopZ